MRTICLVLAVLAVTACGASSSPVPTSGPPSRGPASAAATLTGSAPPNVLEERGPGITVKPGTSGQADLQGGKYRIGWVSSCDSLEAEWAPATGEVTKIAIDATSGEVVVDLPKGPGYLNRVASCPNGTDYTIRFEAAG